MSLSHPHLRSPSSVSQKQEETEVSRTEAKGAHADYPQLTSPSNSKTRVLSTVHSSLDEVEELSIRLKAPVEASEAAREVVRRYMRVRPSCPRKETAAAALHLGCRAVGSPRTFEEVGEAAGIRKYRVRQRQVAIERLFPGVKHSAPGTVDSVSIERYCERIVLPGGSISPASHAAALIARMLSNGVYSGRSPLTVGGVAVLVAALLSKQRGTMIPTDVLDIVAPVVGASPTTIMCAYHEAHHHLVQFKIRSKQLDDMATLPRRL